MCLRASPALVARTRGPVGVGVEVAKMAAPRSPSCSSVGYRRLVPHVFRPQWSPRVLVSPRGWGMKRVGSFRVPLGLLGTRRERRDRCRRPTQANPVSELPSPSEPVAITPFHAVAQGRARRPAPRPGRQRKGRVVGAGALGAPFHCPAADAAGGGRAVGSGTEQRRPPPTTSGPTRGSGPSRGGRGRPTLGTPRAAPRRARRPRRGTFSLRAPRRGSRRAVAAGRARK